MNMNPSKINPFLGGIADNEISRRNYNGVYVRVCVEGGARYAEALRQPQKTAWVRLTSDEIALLCAITPQLASWAIDYFPELAKKR
jgi:hypothetical protein